MREMKNRLLAIEAELQTLYRETGDESEVSLALANTRSLCSRDVLFVDDFLLLAFGIFNVERFKSLSL